MMGSIMCWLRGHQWVAPVRAGADMGRACRRCWYSDQLTAHVFHGRDGSVTWGRFAGCRNWEWPDPNTNVGSMFVCVNEATLLHLNEIAECVRAGHRVETGDLYRTPDGYEVRDVYVFNTNETRSD